MINWHRLFPHPFWANLVSQNNLTPFRKSSIAVPSLQLISNLRRSDKIEARSRVGWGRDPAIQEECRVTIPAYSTNWLAPPCSLLAGSITASRREPASPWVPRDRERAPQPSWQARSPRRGGASPA